MADLVERLRTELTAGQFLKVGDLIQQLVDERREAADEIERLRRFIDQPDRDFDWELDRLRSEGAYDRGRDGWNE